MNIPLSGTLYFSLHDIHVYSIMIMLCRYVPVFAGSVSAVYSGPKKIGKLKK
jgi:hypothetical protein